MKLAAALVALALGGAVTVQSGSPGTPPPIPAAGPLAAPKSLQQVGVPVPLTRERTPAEDPPTPEKVALGERLFFDGRLSADGTVACATCHDPQLAFTDGRPTSIGIQGRAGQRNAPTIGNAFYNPTQFWDGRATSLEQQASMVIVNPVEMGQPSVDAAVAAVARDAEYRAQFEAAYHRPPNADDLLRAIAAYERTQILFDAPFDHFIVGEPGAISEAAKRGWQLFNGKAHCNKCHALSSAMPDSTLFTDHDFHNIGIGIIRHNVVAIARQAAQVVASGDKLAIDRAAIATELTVLGRYMISKRTQDIAAFKTPNLRNVMVTAPYFHDGSQLTLWDTIDHYNKGDGLQNPWLDEDIQPLALTEHEIDDLVAFMASLTSPQYAQLGTRELIRQRLLAAISRPQRDTRRAFAPKPVQPPAPSL